MSKRNWSKYNRELVSRGTLQFLISKEAIKDIQTFRPRSNGGRPKKFPDLLIEILLTVKIHYTLSYRSLEGFSSSVFTSLKKSFQTPTPMQGAHVLGGADDSELQRQLYDPSLGAIHSESPKR